MIKADKDELEINGTTPELLSELTIIMIGLMQKCEVEVEDLAKTIAIAQLAKLKEDEKKSKVP